MNRLGLVWSLGFSQLICWGISYYLIGALGEAIVADLGWGKPTVYGGFSAALLVMGLSSGPIGSLIDRYGGTMMSAGSLLLALSCVLLIVMESPCSITGRGAASVWPCA